MEKEQIIMKNSEIHEGLPQKEIRDFLSMSMVKAFDEESNNKKNYSALAKLDNSIERAIAIARADIKFLEKYINNLTHKQAILNLIELNGWQEHDVSDITEKDIDGTLWMNFIGTEEEHIKFCADNENR